MKFTSTRQNESNKTAAEAIMQGIAEDGGLFVPESFPRITCEELEVLRGKPYEKVAAAVLGKYLTDYSPDELNSMTEKAYARFDHPERIPLIKLGSNEHVLELWHGPTLAFKDVALQILPHFMSAAMKKTGYNGRIMILTATSGDTGKAALEGFADVANTAICVFYPKDGVSSAQKLQMCTQEGSNVCVYGVEGNFDDVQTSVKTIFTDPAFKTTAAGKGIRLSSANSINFGRLAPQIAYYVWAYLRMRECGAVQPGGKINIVVPTGNFGNILAGYYAAEMGLPINKLICASNSNNVLTDFFNKGSYDSRRDFHRTISPSMDILVSSNLERLLFEITERDGTQVRRWMEALKSKGYYDIGKAAADKLQSRFWADWCSEAETKCAISRAFKQNGYLMDTHTAVGQEILERYNRSTGDDTPAVLASTANPFKFSADVLSALKGGEVLTGGDFDAARALSAYTNIPIPHAIAELETKPVRFPDWCTASDMQDRVEAFMGRI